jgi:hypothetical protein
MPIPMRPIVAVAIAALVLTGCRDGLRRQYEYEEELYLELDGSATLFVNASVASLVAMRGLDLDVAPRARLDRARIGAAFEAPGVDVIRVSGSRRHERRFVHVRLETTDVRQFSRVAPLAWSEYIFDRREEGFVFVQTVGKTAARDLPDVGWTGTELVAFRIHLPSRIRYHDAPPGNLRRGNILVWEQPLAERRAGRPLHMEAHIDPESILHRTLWLFATTGAVVALTFLAVIWWIVRRGRTADPTTS